MHPTQRRRLCSICATLAVDLPDTSTSLAAYREHRMKRWETLLYMQSTNV
jgi:hypothetical protein